VIGEFAALGAAVCWAIAPILYRKAMSNASPVSANIIRLVSNAVVMVVILFALGLASVVATLPWQVLVLVVVSGLIGLGLGDTLYLVGLKAVGVARAVPLAATYPLFSLLWTSALLGQSVTSLAVAGAVVIVVGIWLLSREKGDVTIHFRGRKVAFGVLASLLTAVVWSVSIAMMDYVVTLSGAVSSLEVNFAIVTVRVSGMALAITALAPLLDRKREFLRVTRKTVVLLCVGGLVANGLGWLLLNYSFQNIQAQAIPISSTTPLFSMLAAFMLFREKLTRNNVTGALLVVAGVVLIFLV
jgi:drug/metabolite transporter (DMT)-like permease